MVCGGRRHSSSHRKEYRSLVIGQAYSGRTGRTSGLPSVGVELILPLGPDDIYLKAPTVAFGIHDRTMLNLTEPCSEYPFFSLSAPSMSSKTDEMYSLSARGLSFMGC